MLIDLHTHARPVSWDSNLTPDELIEYAKAAGLDGICLSEHDFFREQQEVEELARRHNYLVLPAIEVNTEDGHILAYGLDKYVYGMHRSHELAEHIARTGGVLIASHPYRRQLPWRVKSEQDYEEALARASRNPAYRHCVALEAINGRGSERENEFSRRLCELMAMRGTAGSDAHDPDDVGRCATYFERSISSIEELIDELKAGRFRPLDLSLGPAK